jgi:hypothetical protein
VRDIVEGIMKRKSQRALTEAAKKKQPEPEMENLDAITDEVWGELEKIREQLGNDGKKFEFKMIQDFISKIPPFSDNALAVTRLDMGLSINIRSASQSIGQYWVTPDNKRYQTGAKKTLRGLLNNVVMKYI